MINNIQNLFSRYKQSFNIKKEIENKTIFYIKEKTSLELSHKNLKIDIKNKKIKLINLNSSLRFFLKNKFSDEFLEEFEKEISFKLNY